MRERTLTVSQLNEYVKGVFEDELVLHDINVEGEVYEFKKTASACFLTLKDGDSMLNCVTFESVPKLAVGDKASLFGSITFYAKSGKISFVFKSAKKLGQGNINADLIALKERLNAEGIFSVNKPIPFPVLNAAIVTAETGAVIHDFVKTTFAYRKLTNIYVFSSLVQGKFAADDLVRNLRAADEKRYDVIVIARGGGSADDLSVFNDENVVRTVASLYTPVISAVGHETDYTLCDFAASVRAGTPSIAGELIANKNEEFFQRFYNAVAMLETNIKRAQSRAYGKLIRSATSIAYLGKLKLQTADGKIAALANSLYDKVCDIYNSRKSAVLNCYDRIEKNTVDAYENRNTALKENAAKLENNNPLRILSAGYGKIYNKYGAVSSVDDTDVGENIDIALNDGRLTATVSSKHKIRR